MFRRESILLFFLLLTVAARGQILFSRGSGVYADTFSVRIFSDARSSVLRYTIDGSDPTSESPLYTRPLSVDQLVNYDGGLYKVQCAVDSLWFVPQDVERVPVLKAAAFDGEGKLCSDVIVATYLVDSLFGRHLDLPVLSIVLDDSLLTDYRHGIMVPGAHQSDHNLGIVGNFDMRGREWERKAHVEFFDRGGVYFSQYCGLRIHGGSTRRLMQKSFSLYAREEYGEKAFLSRLFADRPQQKFKRLCLRPFSSSWTASGVEDYVSQRIAEPLRCDNLATRPAVLFINGEYWGIYFLSEKPDERYVQEHFGVDVDDVDLVLTWGDEVENGDGERWWQLVDWLKQNDASSEENFLFLSSQVDIPALMDYMLLQVFLSNVDWPVRNVRCFGTENMKWRWLFYDADATLACWRQNEEILGYLTCDDSLSSYPSSAYATLLFRRLLSNRDFKQQSVARMYELADSLLSYDRTSRILAEIFYEVGPEVIYQNNRFGAPLFRRWLRAIDVIDCYLSSRPALMPRDYARHIGVVDLDSEAQSQSQLILFPNPSNGNSRIVVDAEPDEKTHSCDIYTMQGQLVWSGTIENDALLEGAALPTLPSGMYVIRVKGIEKPVKWIIH